MTTPNTNKPDQPAPPNPDTHTAQFKPLAGLCACILPGLGHIILGQKKRGFLIMAAVLSLFTLGILVGGIGVVEHDTTPGPNGKYNWKANLWFYGQAFNGPITFVVDNVRSNLEGQYDPSIGRANEIGTLYCAMAGLLNLLVIINALCVTPYPQPDKPNQRGRVLTQEDNP